MIKKVLAISFFLILSAPVYSCTYLGVSNINSSEYLSISLCEVMTHPEGFDRQKISFNARVWTDYIDNSVLIDPACEGRAMAFGRHNPEARGLDDLATALDEASTRPMSQVSAHFVGTFEWPADDPFERGIFIHSVTDIEVVTDIDEN